VNAYFLNYVETKLFFNLKEVWGEKKKKIQFYYSSDLNYGLSLS